jgi:hypothetical protein
MNKQENREADTQAKQLESLTDLPVADEQADATKGGAASKATPKLFLFCADGEH